MALAQTDTRYALEVYGLSKVFSHEEGANIVLDNVSFQVREGEFVALVGPSGCGKTTALRIVANLTPISKGTIKLFGKEIIGGGADFGFVFQAANLLPWRTALENVVLPLEILGRKGPEVLARGRELLKDVGLAGAEHLRPAELSGGMQQRVGIARALVHDPKVLLLDEPFGALDAITRETLDFQLLRIWESQKKTVLFVTHSIEEAVLLSDRVMVMRPSPGQIVLDYQVPFPRPRTSELLTETGFLKEVRQLRDTIRQYYEF